MSDGYITGTWGWEVPAGWAEPGEEPPAAVAREIEEETGWRSRRIEHLVDYRPLAGLSDQRYLGFLATGVTFVRDAAGSAETTSVAWHPSAEVGRLIASVQVSDGPSVLLLSYYRASLRD